MCTRKEVTKSPRDMDQHEAFSRDTNWHPMFYFLKPIYQTTKQPPSSKLYFFYFPSMITKFVADHILQQHTHNTMGSKTRRCNITQELIYQCIHWWMGFGPTLYIKAFRWGCSPTVKIFLFILLYISCVFADGQFQDTSDAYSLKLELLKTTTIHAHSIFHFHL
jgi:hypothetical protein